MQFSQGHTGRASVEQLVSQNAQGKASREPGNLLTVESAAGLLRKFSFKIKHQGQMACQVSCLGVL